MEAASWSALPPRKKRANQNNPSDQPQSTASIQPTAPTTPSVPSARRVVSNHQQILDNIEARKTANHGISTLLSKDGCSGKFYEYLDHTADVQCHAWGESLKDAFENMAQCMMNYMTDLTLVQEDAEETVSMTVTGHDLKSLLYNYMNEVLFKFSSDCFCTCRVEIASFNEADFSLKANLYGDIYDPEKHSSGTEIKAITYSNMQIHVHDTGLFDASMQSGIDRVEHSTVKSGKCGDFTRGSGGTGRVDLYVIVDI